MMCAQCSKETDNKIGEQYSLDFAICENCFVSIGLLAILAMLYVNLKPRLRMMVDAALSDIGVVLP